MSTSLQYFRYATFDDGQLVEFPYRDQGQFMYVFLPDEGHIEQAASYASLFASMPLTKRFAAFNDGIYVNMGFPNFQMNSAKNASFSLKQSLQQLGITDAFDSKKADFSGIDGDKDLFVYDLLHQVSLKWNEITTWADSGAGSQQDQGLGAGGGIMPTPAEVDITFNRSFLYFIRDTNTPQPITLFAGVAHSP